MSKTISSVLTSGYVLNTSPLIITSTGGVETSGGTAIYGSLAQAWTINNAGTVSGGNVSGSLGVDLRAGGLITNTGLISGYTFGARIRGAAGTVTNSSRISSHTDGVVLFDGGQVTNMAGGQITGSSNVGVYFGGAPGTVTNAGTIAGGIDAVQFVGQFDDRVIFDAGAIFRGTVAGGGGNNTLELAAGTSAVGTLADFGSQFAGFGTIDVDAGASWKIDNTNTFGSGVLVTDAGTLTNTGTIAITVTVASGGLFENFGKFSGGISTYGVILSGGAFVNEAGGQLFAAYGVADNTSPGMVTNGGRLGGFSYAVTLNHGGSVTNLANAVVYSGDLGVVITGGTGAVTNAGTMSGFDAVVLRGGGSVSNAAGGYIAAAKNVGVYISGGAGTVTNAGTILGGNYAVQFVGDFAGLVVDDPGAVFIGKVEGATVGNTLELAQGTGVTVGTLSGFATEFANFNSITIDAGANWTLGGTETIGPSVTVIDSGTLTNNGSIGGTVSIASGGLLKNAGTIAGSLTLTDAGTVTNTGSIRAPVSIASGGLFGNSGTIAGNNVLTDAGTLTNTGSIGTAVTVTSGGLFDNFGRFVGNTVSTYGVVLSGGTFVNEAGGQLYFNYGVVDKASPGTVTNAGVLFGFSYAVQLMDGGSVTNLTSGVVRSGDLGVIITGGTGAVTNAGTMSGFDAVVLRAGGSVSNAASGYIAAAKNVGVYISGGAGTVTNAGTILGGNYAVQFVGDFAGLVIDDPGAVFIGKVEGATVGNTLELAQGTSGAAGTLSIFATQFNNFSSIIVDTGANWTISSAEQIGSGVTMTDDGTLTNDGSIATTITVAGGGMFDNFGTVTLGVLLTGGGNVTNEANAKISGANAVEATSNPATVSNAGSISGGTYGVLLDQGGSITNLILGSVYGTSDGARITGTTVGVSNAGAFTGGLDGLVLLAGGSVSNATGGVIAGTQFNAVYISGGAGTVTQRRHHVRRAPRGAVRGQLRRPADRRPRRGVQRRGGGRQRHQHAGTGARHQRHRHAQQLRLSVHRLRHHQRRSRRHLGVRSD